ncbi:hypothetical protein VTP01DRAFT_10211 [Rhizomucor pusillus]|uniref:uncharacterized protein n=1 Tax=Rhizomucor pusillus TaxID=4840 RepID=UPI00374296EC
MFPSEIQAAFTFIMTVYWQFLTAEWPVLARTKYHRTDTKEVKDIQYVKSYVLEHLGYIPVFFFPVELFGKDEYPGPYRGVEKGLLILYQLLTGASIAQMARFIPASSFHAIYHAFYVKHGDSLGRVLDECLRTMFSFAKMIDGHDSRATYINAADHAMFYSYKLKNSGFRAQVCTDINGMVLFVSDAAPCLTNNDGSIPSEMNLKGKVTKYDCVVIDGGYALFDDRVLANNPHLGKQNIVVPARKQRGADLTAGDAKYNSVLGSFCSSIESTFGEIGHLFQRFSGKSVVRVGDMNTFTVQFKLACVWRNIKKFVHFMVYLPRSIIRIGCNPRRPVVGWMSPCLSNFYVDIHVLDVEKIPRRLPPE